MDTIKEYKPFYQIELKRGDTIDISEEAYSIMRKALIESDKHFIEIWWSIYNRFEITRVVEKSLDTVEEFITSQSPEMKAMIRAEEKRRGTPWTGIWHVNNFIAAKSDG